jgi:hypothetical protein
VTKGPPPPPPHLTEQKCGKSVGVYVFYTIFEVFKIGIIKKQNDGKKQNILRIMPPLLTFKTNTCN